MFGEREAEPHRFAGDMLGRVNAIAPPVGETYPGLVPNEFDQWKMGIPGMHFPMPDAPAET